MRGHSRPRIWPAPIPITAAKRYGAIGVGIEMDSMLIRRANDNLREAGVGDRVRFVCGDLFETDISAATVVTLFLLPRLNERLMPQIRRKLRPGARIVSPGHIVTMSPDRPA